MAEVGQIMNKKIIFHIVISTEKEINRVLLKREQGEAVGTEGCVNLDRVNIEASLRGDI